jgi:hypothetical protein
MRPGAVTHHFDTDQRYRELVFEPPFMPGGSNALFPRRVPRRCSP